MAILKDYFMTEDVPMSTQYMDFFYVGDEIAEQRKELDDMGKSRGYIPNNRNFALVLGNNTSTLLAELCDKQDFYKSSRQLNSQGEFFYTVVDCEINTGLSRREQNTCIDKLKKRGFIKSTISRGMPRIRFFKMAEDEVIIKLLSDLCVEAETKRIKIYNRNIEDKSSILQPSKECSSAETQTPLVRIANYIGALCNLRCAERTVINNYI